jgi:hypothetical protein
MTPELSLLHFSPIYMCQISFLSEIIVMCVAAAFRLRDRHILPPRHCSHLELRCWNENVCVCVCVCVFVSMSQENTSVVCVCDTVVTLNSGVSISDEYIHDRKKITWVYMTGSAHQTEISSLLSILVLNLLQDASFYFFGHNYTRISGLPVAESRDPTEQTTVSGSLRRG